MFLHLFRIESAQTREPPKGMPRIYLCRIVEGPRPASGLLKEALARFARRACFNFATVGFDDDSAAVRC